MGMLIHSNKDWITLSDNLQSLIVIPTSHIKCVSLSNKNEKNKPKAERNEENKKVQKDEDGSQPDENKKTQKDDDRSKPNLESNLNSQSEENSNPKTVDNNTALKIDINKDQVKEEKLQEISDQPVLKQSNIEKHNEIQIKKEQLKLNNNDENDQQVEIDKFKKKK
ncbi:hypothetical protein E2K98_30200 [Bacillus salipaludis]|uniref:Uncharacterized protein n=1 Tax=Bacillus salipaludis TaxID=2547811 RepID=A0A4R5VHR5_9BACI|nr:hypothetical protein [Bacillus salipaludis]TDK53404.1 hypothetical protein E2K98_30200 [Bacillus salipaludis]